MKPSPKVKVSVSIAADLVKLIDRQVERRGGSRSSVMEDWLRRAARDQAHRDFDAEIDAYYETLTPDQRAEDQEWEGFGAAAAKKPAEAGPRARGRGRRA